jgi:ligand-binding sensor domain-containing protein
MCQWIVSTLLVSCLLGGVQAAQHRLSVYPNPSITIFSITEGPDGFLWLAAADGLYRFDGFHYHKITEFPLSSARFAAFMADGSLWAGGYEGLARLVNNRFQILDSLEVFSFAAYRDRVFARSADFRRILLDGSLTRLPHAPLLDLNVDPTGRLWFICRGLNSACWIDPDKPETLHSIPLAAGYRQVLPGASGRIWAASDDQAVLLENGRPVLERRRQPYRSARRPGPLLPGAGGQIWFLGETVQGLTSEVDFRDREDSNRFRPISGYEDSRGQLWVGSENRGLVKWSVDPEWRRWFPEHLSGEPAMAVMRDHRGSALLATHEHIYRLEGDRWNPLTRKPYRYDGLLPLPDGGYLASIRELGVVRLSPEGDVAETVRDESPVSQDYREIVRDGEGRYWVGTKRGLYRIVGARGSLRLELEQLPASGNEEFLQAVDLEVDARGRLWTGYAGGIAWLDEQGLWNKIHTDQPVDMLRSFALAGDEIWVAHRRAGAFSRLRRDGDVWRVTLFPANAGYGPVDTHFLKRDSRGWIWRGSPDGVHISDGRHAAPDDWIHIHMGNGLAASNADMYGFFEDTDGSVWIAGAEGVTHFRPDASWFAASGEAPAPRITRVAANEKVFLYPSPLPESLPSGTRVLQLDIGSLHAAPFRDRPLRYRLLPVSEQWELSRDGTLRFSDLPEDDYVLEAGYSGNGASAVTAYRFRIGPEMAIRPWLWLFGFLMAGGALVPIARKVPWLDTPRFRIEKALFLLRRRYRGERARGAPEAHPPVRDDSGTTLAGRYHLIRIIAGGGFSTVYEACDLREESGRLAVKILNRGPAQEGWIRDRFAHEVAALRSVNHQGVVCILDSWITAEGEPILVMPFLDGMTLRTVLSHGPFGAERAARSIRHIGAALSEVHGRGIVHRDLKPENLIVQWPHTEKEQPVIIDFGTAGLRGAENELADTTLMAGSFHYMAPERLTGHYSAASDLFSLGVMILEMLTGKRLADLNTMYSDASFLGELENALRSSLGDVPGCRTLAERLAPAYCPEPRLRPAVAAQWADEVADAIVMCQRFN